jgi:hypothetical protein
MPGPAQVTTGSTPPVGEIKVSKGRSKTGCISSRA